MLLRTDQPTVPIYPLEPDAQTGNPHFRLYQFDGTLPDQADLLVPHRKAYYLLVFIRRASSRQWIDMTPYALRDNTVYLTTPNQVIVKEGFTHLWSTGIAFTPAFLSFQESAALSRLPLLQHPSHGPELPLAEADVQLVEELLGRITAEYARPGAWQQPMLTAYLTVLLTHLSRRYTDYYADQPAPTDRLLLTTYQATIDAHFRTLHQVSDYAALLNVSAGYLSELVKAQSGQPAIVHIHDRLVLEARRLLFHTAWSLKEIAFDLGFSDASYFNRFFKRETGQTPADYRTAIREMYQ